MWPRCSPLLVGVQYVAQMAWVAVCEREPACDGVGAGRVDVGHVGKAGEGVEADDPAVWVVRLVDAAQRGEGGEVASAVHAELHDDAGNVEDHPVEGVQREQVRQWLPAQVQGQVVDQFLEWDGCAGQQVGEAVADRPLVVRLVRQDSVVGLIVDHVVSLGGAAHRWAGARRKSLA